MNSNSGFTMTELIVVIAIVSIAAFFSYPTMTNFKKAEQLKSEIRFAVNSLVNARFEAFKTNSNVVVQFKDNKYYAFVDNGANGGVAKDNLYQEGERRIVSHQLQHGLSVITNYNSDRVRFKNRVGIRPGTITFLENGNPYVAVVLNVNGRVRVKKL